MTEIKIRHPRWKIKIRRNRSFFGNNSNLWAWRCGYFPFLGDPCGAYGFVSTQPEALEMGRKHAWSRHGVRL